ncbi:acyl-CoA dehydrogenase family protein [Pseudohalioglobus lutimaris]|uniref:Acyl-CoA dehydrogenase n=1 Tax=Pseudohalioglobus lutimaris TaxID=1737061 RepID=A0A2N5X7X9_9GAMM|nr:acyl-CoA dehydrogenase family protein [Pseudohalioglobus lutimaris]PLW70582.1 acyl-CoA dehydrogenase [Pseudohalioglobus lutimaris]
MDFEDTPEQAQFRADVVAWLDANARRRTDNLLRGMEGEQAFLEAKDWYARKAAAGFACLTWPREYGGAGLTPLHDVIWAQEVAKYETRDAQFVIGIGNCGPAIMHFAEEAAKLELLPRMASAEDVWCQLFSEPSAGSDVAGLRTRAERKGDDWILNGQKIWTSGAQHSDYGVVLTRTDPTVSKYRGLTMFMIDMRQSGVEVRPIKQMDGGQHFNEVFFNDAVVPDNYRLGEVGGGWTGALTVLMSERLAISGVQPTGFPQFLDLVKSLELNGEPIANDPIVRERLATWYSQYAGLQAANKRMLTAVAKGGVAGAEASLGKLVGAVMNQEIANFACQLFGQAGIIQEDELSPEQAHFQKTVLFSPGVRLAGGTDEVMRNILAEQVLGLPQEPRADKGMAFQDIPNGKG